MRTYYVLMRRNLTLSLDEELLQRARQVARRMGKSLNQLVREYLEVLTRRDEVEGDMEELRRLSAEGGGRSGERRIVRDELHERS